MASFFENVEFAAPDVIFNMVAEFKKDPNPDKITALIGAYVTEEGKPYVLPVVRNVEQSIANDQTLNHEYLSIEGMKEMSDAAVKLALGPENNAIIENRAVGVQTLSGTGAVRLALAFLYKYYPTKPVYVSKPTWGNHKKIIDHVGFKDTREYKYYFPETRGVDIAGMISDLEAAPEGSIILLHACAHNPCGTDPSQDEWKTIADLIERRRLFPLFDMAYQGFVSGDPDTDAWAIRYFQSRGMEMLICQSFAKIFGIYNERCGNLTAVCSTSTQAMNVVSQLKGIIRPMYSNPPNHGARIVATILNNKALSAEWRDQLKGMAGRILSMRQLFHDALKRSNVPGDWTHILKQNGMFTFTGLTPKQCVVLKEKHHIYLLKSGRMNMCAINHKNVDRFVLAFKDVVENVTDQSNL